MPRIVTRLDGSDESQAIIGRDLRLVFTWIDDRWSHVVMPGRSGDPVRPLVMSYQEESDSEPATAVNQPVYQQLHFQSDGDSCLAMLVGQAGHEHYSSCIRFSEHSNGSTHLEFDVANRQTRATGRAAALAPTYLVDLPLTEMEEASHRLVRWNCGQPNGRLMLGSVEESDHSPILLVSEAGRRGCLAQVFSRHIPESPAQRCLYRWTWESPISGPSGSIA